MSRFDHFVVQFAEEAQLLTPLERAQLIRKSAAAVQKSVEVGHVPQITREELEAPPPGKPATTVVNRRSKQLIEQKQLRARAAVVMDEFHKQLTDKIALYEEQAHQKLEEDEDAPLPEADETKEPEEEDTEDEQSDPRDE